MRILTTQEQIALLKACSEKLGFRNAMIIRMFLYTGLRVSELSGLKFDDIFMGREPKKFFVVREEIAKGKVVREIPLSESLRVALREYYNTCITNISTEPVDPARPLFTQHKKTEFPLTPRQVQRIVQLAGELINIPDLHPHTLRHTFATTLMRVTDMRTVQMILGHRSLTSTQVYTHPSSDDTLKAVNNLS
jgi:integrase/recombinase XerC